MASPSSGTCSGGSSSLQSYDHDETSVLLMEQRKRKRMISNRESARRSRMRKQKHLDDLMVQLTHLRSDNHQIVTNINVVDHLLLNVESENSVLRAQFSELNNRLQALGDIITFMNAKNTTTERDYGDNINNYDQMTAGADDFFNPWNSFHGVNQPMIGCNIDAFMC